MVGCVQPYFCQNTDLCEICLDIHGLNIAKPYQHQIVVYRMHLPLYMMSMLLSKYRYGSRQLKRSEKINAILDKR